MVVDDSHAMAFVVQAILQRAGYEVRTANDAGNGYLSYLTFRPDLVIADLEMPWESGLQMMEEIRVHDPAIKVIYMSADASPFSSQLDDERKKYWVAFLQKPFSKTEMLQIVRQSEQVKSTE